MRCPLCRRSRDVWDWIIPVIAVVGAGAMLWIASQAVPHTAILQRDGHRVTRIRYDGREWVESTRRHR